MGRFLLFISYVGSKYSGLQSQWVGGVHRDDIKTIVGTLQKYVQKLDSSCRIGASSRTDVGVHAMCNSIHVDLSSSSQNPLWLYDPLHLQKFLNRSLSKAKEDIRVLKAVQVNGDFHARKHAHSRSYVYRLAVHKQPGQDISYISPLDYKRCYPVLQPFKFDKFEAAARFLCGTHDFTAFAPERSWSDPRNFGKNPVKTITISIKRGCSFLGQYQPLMSDNFDFWEVHIDSKSFLHRQIRKMVTVMLDYARGNLRLEGLKHLLETTREEKMSLAKTIKTIPGGGLFLKSVQYNEEDLVYNAPPCDETEDVQTVSVTEMKDKILTLSREMSDLQKELKSSKQNDSDVQMLDRLMDNWNKVYNDRIMCILKRDSLLRHDKCSQSPDKDQGSSERDIALHGNPCRTTCEILEEDRRTNILTRDTLLHGKSSNNCSKLPDNGASERERRLLFL